MTLKIEVYRTFDAIRIKFNGILHLHFTRSDLLGVQAWIREPESRWYIEYTMKSGGLIVCDYDSSDKWRGVLDQLEKAL